MQNLIYQTNEALVLESFDIRHSVLKFRGLENKNIVIEFQGMFYIELPRILNGIEIWKQTENEQEDFIKRRPKLQGRAAFLKMISDNETYYIAALGVNFEQ